MRLDPERDLQLRDQRTMLLYTAVSQSRVFYVTQPVSHVVTRNINVINFFCPGADVANYVYKVQISQFAKYKFAKYNKPIYIECRD